MNFKEAAESVKSEGLSIVNASEWSDHWDDHYVIFADLIAFANRCILSSGITVNNLVRFHRAISDALEGIDDIVKYQFTDACFIVTKNVKSALIVATNIQNECLIHNHVQIEKVPHPLFFHMIVPKIAITKGSVLEIKSAKEIESIEKYSGISPNEFLAGEGIVRAYYLEKNTTGGLISVDPNYIEEFKKVSSGSSKIKTNSLYKMWKNDVENKYLSHDNVVDIPWLALQPRQRNKGELKLERTEDFKTKVESFNLIWRANFTEHINERTSTGVMKQYGGGISHLCDLIQMYGNYGQRAWDLTELNEAITKIK
ncbi:hypothetical protein M3P19_04705 [Muricauda sp. 2012CJ35-5]|uniref:Uncharacterized protein n=1 Tax=Flagellimonas spongiicola TaxID=2942208 RepID=A0ABT0PQP6_9FLAO|nr:hypothetical protein [Allomuricauda spongiicola]MCL6273296.1 hypothetical protein [Allomuricauda spongiicola]